MSFFGLTLDKLVLIGVLAALLIGPDKLPGYAAKAARLLRSLRDMANGAKDRVKEEMGPEFSDANWRDLDPRQYDPRRIVRDAVFGDEGEGPAGSAPQAAAGGAGAGAPGARPQRVLREGEAAPFDSEAT